jgi:UDP-N-acetylglucosamine--N-acetylmuramyl-(pentapeptide) pyrophosphoryl-undecaprenol N-acetylglucosamine transferase
VWELAAAGLPAVLVPFPHATADHQTGNAAFMARAGAALVLDDAELDGPRLAGAIEELLVDRERLAAMAAAARGIARRDAADRIAAELLAA